MKFFSTTDLQKDMKNVWTILKKEKEVMITVNGKPSAMLIESNEDSFEELRLNLIRARFTKTLSDSNRRARQNGLDKLSMEEIDEIIDEIHKADETKKANKTKLAKK